MYLEIWKSNKKAVINLEQEEFFNYLEILEKWYELNIVNFSQYFKLKSNLCDVFANKLKNIPDDSNLPF